jgi:hypothetical protein
MSSPDRFDLEQAIMNAWQTIEDIKLVYKRHCDSGMTDDEVQNALLGVSTVGNMRFEELFETFETMIANKHFTR